MSAIISALGKALEADPSNWETRLALLEAYVREDRQGEAVSLLHDVEGPAEDDEAGLLAAARCYALAGSPHARAILDPVFAANPGNARAHLALAFIAHREGDTPAATRHFITATSLDPGLSEADPELAAVYGSVLPAAAGPEAKAGSEAETSEVQVVDAEEREEAGAGPVVMEETPSPLVVTVADEVAEEAGEPGEPEPKHSRDEKDSARRSEEAEAPAEVYFPEPGHVPVQKLADAVTEAKPLIDPKKVAPLSKLIVADDSSGDSSSKPEAVPERLMNVVLEPHEGEKAVYDYRHPDNSVFESEIGPDQILVAASRTEDGKPVASPEESVRVHQAESEEKRMRGVRRDKFQSLFVTAAVHAGVLLLLGVIVISVPREPVPQIVAIASPTPAVETIEKKKVLMPTQAAVPTSSNYRPNIVSALNISEFAVPTVDSQDLQENAVIGTGFSPSLNFGPSGAEGQSFLFGEPIDGTKLGVILDVSGSMAEYLPKVIREIDRNFEKASIVFVNHTRLRSTHPVSTEVRPILTEDVVPYYTEAGIKHRSPYWFLWYDLPRKADQAGVDRLIELFKERPNCYLAVGGFNRVAGAMDHLRGLGIDVLYVFSDFEDFVDEDAAVESARKLSKVGIKTYVQPAQDRTEYLEIMTRKIAMRTKGKELKSLIAVQAVEEKPESILAAVTDPEPIEVEGVNFATVRPSRFGKTYYDEGAAARGWEVISVYEHRNFDLVLYGPHARADIFLKTPEGYIQRPISFRYHSRKWIYNEQRDLWDWRQRKWLRNREPPLLEGNEILWKMVLEDEIEFDVWFRFDDNSFMATYSAELPPDTLSPEEIRRGDAASVGFHIPRLAVEKKDMYYSADFTQGLSLDKLREAMAPNQVVFNLSTKEADRYQAHWELYGWKRGVNVRPFNVLCKALPTGILGAVVSGQSFGPRKVHVEPKQNDILLRSWAYRADIELWEGFSFNLRRPADQTRHRLTKTKAFELTIE